MYILVLDDVELNNVVMTGALHGVPGAEPVTFTEPREALAFLRAHPNEIGVAVTDYEMPEMSGMGFIREARAVRGFEHVPIVMVTSRDERRVRREALEAGATDFLAKPVDVVEVRARVTNLLTLNQARRDQQDRAGWLAREVAAAVAVSESREREIVTRLMRAAEHRDNDTGDHVSRVARYVALIACRLGFDQGGCNRLALASTMHDIGKIGVPDAILLKPGPLTPEERRQINGHAEKGHRILEGSNSDVLQLAADIAISHHERWDGDGYPNGLAGEAIPLAGRIVAVADVFDALASSRPYKQAWPLPEVRQYLTDQAGRQFDPACVDAFLAGWDEIVAINGPFPAGTP